MRTAVRHKSEGILLVRGIERERGRGRERPHKIESALSSGRMRWFCQFLSLPTSTPAWSQYSLAALLLRDFSGSNPGHRNCTTTAPPQSYTSFDYCAYTIVSTRTLVLAYLQEVFMILCYTFSSTWSWSWYLTRKYYLFWMCFQVRNIVGCFGLSRSIKQSMWKRIKHVIWLLY